MEKRPFIFEILDDSNMKGLQSSIKAKGVFEVKRTTQNNLGLKWFCEFFKVICLDHVLNITGIKTAFCIFCDDQVIILNIMVCRI